MKNFDGVYIHSRNTYGIIIQVLPDGYIVEAMNRICGENIWASEEDLYWADESPEHKDRSYIGNHWADIKAVNSAQKSIQTLDELYDVVRACWCKETAYPTCQEDWSQVEEDPSYGQCGVTAMLVQDYCGGSIYRMVFENGSTHYYNKINGKYVDFCGEHYDFEGYILDYDSGREIQRAYFGKSEDTQKRYGLLCRRVCAMAECTGLLCSSEELISYIKTKPIKHARFTYRNTIYDFWHGIYLDWKMDESYESIQYNSQEEILNDPVFDGKTIFQIAPMLEDIRVDLMPDLPTDY